MAYKIHIAYTIATLITSIHTSDIHDNTTTPKNIKYTVGKTCGWLLHTTYPNKPYTEKIYHYGIISLLTTIPDSFAYAVINHYIAYFLIHRLQHNNYTCLEHNPISIPRAILDNYSEQYYDKTHITNIIRTYYDVVPHKKISRLCNTTPPDIIKAYAFESPWHIFQLDHIQAGMFPVQAPQTDSDVLFTKKEIERKIATYIAFMQNNYKIHLMPQSHNLIPVTQKILNEYRKLPPDQRTIQAIKLSGDINIEIDADTIEYDKGKEAHITCMSPRVVIYPIYSKQAAADTLRWIIDTVGTYKGVNVYPRFNSKITSMIYYSQGDSLEKSTWGCNIFDPETDFTFIKTEPFQNIPHLRINNDQRLIDPDTKKPFELLYQHN